MKLGEAITNMELYPEKEYRSDEITLSMHFGVLHIEGAHMDSNGDILLATKRNWIELPKYIELSEAMDLWVSGVTVCCEFDDEIHTYDADNYNFVDEIGRPLSSGEMKEGKWFKF